MVIRQLEDVSHYAAASKDGETNRNASDRWKDGGCRSRSRDRSTAEASLFVPGQGNEPGTTLARQSVRIFIFVRRISPVACDDSHVGYDVTRNSLPASARTTIPYYHYPHAIRIYPSRTVPNLIPRGHSIPPHDPTTNRGLLSLHQSSLSLSLKVCRFRFFVSAVLLRHILFIRDDLCIFVRPILALTIIIARYILL
jgi:hypothetical protein